MREEPWMATRIGLAQQNGEIKADADTTGENGRNFMSMLVRRTGTSTLGAHDEMASYLMQLQAEQRGGDRMESMLSFGFKRISTMRMATRIGIAQQHCTRLSRRAHHQLLARCSVLP